MQNDYVWFVHQMHIQPLQNLVSTHVLCHRISGYDSTMSANNDNSHPSVQILTVRLQYLEEITEISMPSLSEGEDRLWRLSYCVPTTISFLGSDSPTTTTARQMRYLEMDTNMSGRQNLVKSMSRLYNRNLKFGFKSSKVRYESMSVCCLLVI